jgi:hypothetical protein
MMFIKPTVKSKATSWPEFQHRNVPPCRLCAFAVPIYASREHNHGRQCIWYGVRLPADELEQPSSDVRQHCVRDGNNFQWPLKGFTSEKVLELRMKLTDWNLQRSSTVVQRLSSIISLVLSGIAIVVSVTAMLVKTGN